MMWFQLEWWGYLARHNTKKFARTLTMLFRLGMARTFGSYEISVYNDGLSYARYRWRGQTWAFPIGPLKTNRE